MYEININIQFVQTGVRECSKIIIHGGILKKSLNYVLSQLKNINTITLHSVYCQKYVAPPKPWAEPRFNTIRCTKTVHPLESPPLRIIPLSIFWLMGLMHLIFSLDIDLKYFFRQLKIGLKLIFFNFSIIRRRAISTIIWVFETMTTIDFQGRESHFF